MERVDAWMRLLGAAAFSLTTGSSSLSAQLSTERNPIESARTPVEAARSMVAARQDARTVSDALRRVHGRSLAETVSIMKTVGFDARSMAGALKSTFVPSASELHGALSGSGISAAEVSEAMLTTGFTLDCVSPLGDPVPCGNLGGASDTPAMGQLTVSPSPEGQTKGELTITGSNIPSVKVRLGFHELYVFEKTASQLRVRLPDSPATGDLRIVRISDQVSGLLVAGYKVVAAPLPWANWAMVAHTQAMKELRGWYAGAQILSGCTVNGALANAPIGSLTSTYVWAGHVKSSLLQLGAPNALAETWDNVIRDAFTAFVSQTALISAPVYPALLNFPGAHAPPTANVPFPLVGMVSGGTLGMEPTTLKATLATSLALAGATDEGLGAGAELFATLTSAKFAALLANSRVHNLMGEGPVPLYLPPSVPSAPVANGKCSGTGIVHLSPDSP
ncbi:MAG: hypothetical protein IT357_02680 [Gemmatimonadaceae bacterium]|nr:hypothetical protein [Gemmatimonadaceae bacterium]